MGRICYACLYSYNKEDLEPFCVYGGWQAATKTQSIAEFSQHRIGIQIKFIKISTIFKII